MGGRYEPGMFVFYIFIYLFLASLGLHCRAGVLELWRGGAALQLWLALSGFSRCGARPVAHAASVAVECGFSSCGSQALEHRLNS